MLTACGKEPVATPTDMTTVGPTPTATAPSTAGNPPPCLDAKLVWADVLGRLLLTNCIDQFDMASVETVWAWDGSVWELLSADGPPGNVVTGMAWDPDRDVLVRYGGIPLPDQECGTETWEWDMTAWRQVDADAPEPCDHIELAWDGVDGRILLFGGGRGRELDPGTWAWDGSEWTQVSDAGPAPRAHHGMFGGNGTIPGGRPVVHGGFDDSRVFEDMWVWNGSDWEEWPEDGSTPPSARSHHGLAGGAPGPLVFGGATTTSTFDSLTDETWYYEFIGWRKIAADAPHPSARGLPALGYDVAREVFVLYGGFGPDGTPLADTWEFNHGTWRCMAGC